MGLFDFGKKKDVQIVVKSPDELRKEYGMKSANTEKYGDFYKAIDGNYHRNYPITGTQYEGRGKNWLKASIGEPLKLRFYKFKGKPAVEILSSRGSLGNIKAIHSDQVTDLQRFIVDAKLYGFQIMVRRVRSTISIAFSPDAKDVIYEVAKQELLEKLKNEAKHPKQYDDEDDDSDNDSDE